jgi:predicted RNA binding protein YcfA (HicA-like mRNA interferase family)
MFEVPFGKLRDLLEQLGFTTNVVSGSHIIFQHPDNELSIILRPYEENDRVEQAGLQVIRFQLDSWGLMDCAEFDEQMRQLSLVG